MSMMIIIVCVICFDIRGATRHHIAIGTLKLYKVIYIFIKAPVLEQYCRSRANQFY